MLQRVAFVAIGLIFLVGTFHEPGRVGAWIYALLILVASGIGAALAARQVWLQSLPKDQVPACGMGLSYMLDSMPFIDAMRRVLEGSGECAEKAWVFLGLSIAGWSLAFFVAMAFIGIALVRRD
jgi:disulfide bond formation protein DsbB